MQKKSKTIFTAVITALFALSVSYFALLAPTTAWFYQEDTTSKNYSFVFGDFKMDEEARIENATIPLRAATRFADAGEVLFDEVIHVVKVDVENQGGVTGQVVVNVTENDSLSGLKWFIYDTTAANEIAEVSASASAAKGAYKTAIETMLATYSVTPLDYKNTTAINALSGSSYDEKYETYNATALAALDSHNAQKILVQPDEQKVVYVVFWAEFGEVKSTLDVDTPVTIGNYDVDIEFVSSPYMPEYQTVSIENTASDTVNLFLYLNGSTTPYTGKYYVNNGSTRQEMIASGNLIGAIRAQTVEIELEVGTPYKLVIANSGLSLHFENPQGQIGTVSGTTDMIITDTVSNTGNRIIIASNS